MSEARPLYAVLGVPADASQDTIKKAYRGLALQHHPDRQQNQSASTEEAFARIAFAYEVLGQEQRRKRYDLTGEVPQSDSALGRRAGETFLAEYVKAAPKVARGVTQADMSLHNLANYEVLEVDGRDVPDYMRGIVMQGLNYLVAVVDGMEEKEVVLLRHFVMDQMYALLAYSAPLDDDAFAERGYIITYYDHPLQAGIRPTWSDQNDPSHRSGRALGLDLSRLRQIDPAVFERRRMVALEWHGAPAAGAARVVERTIPGEGLSPERLRLGIHALVHFDQDVEARTVHHVRRELERLLRLEEHSLDSVGATALMSQIYEAMADEEENVEEQEDELSANDNVAETQPSGDARLTDSVAAKADGPTVGSSVVVHPTGRRGVVLLAFPEDPELTYKVQFSDGSPDDWFRQADVRLA
mmetsp:Transcript_67133/g.187862  ORF Transcript_67133/g.187862 Transcript_67133/m.187862 type:complete len:413 (-) Transcript_67133:105-1343(-)